MLVIHSHRKLFIHLSKSALRGNVYVSAIFNLLYIYIYIQYHQQYTLQNTRVILEFSNISTKQCNCSSQFLWKTELLMHRQLEDIPLFYKLCHLKKFVKFNNTVKFASATRNIYTACVQKPQPYNNLFRTLTIIKPLNRRKCFLKQKQFICP